MNAEQHRSASHRAFCFRIDVHRWPICFDFFRTPKVKGQAQRACPLVIELVISKRLFRFAGTLFSVALARQCFLGALLLTRLQVEGMALDLFYDVLLLDLSFESAQLAFQGFSVLDVDFCKLDSPAFVTASTGMRYTPDFGIAASCFPPGKRSDRRVRRRSGSAPGIRSRWANPARGAGR